MIRPDDTIVAVATAWAPAGIGVIRLSGPRARAIVEDLFRVSLHDWGMVHCRLQDPGTHTALDEVIISHMAAPRSYTGEDVVEISCHGSIPVLNRIRSILISAGTRHAEPGEFSQRAYLNGKIDLAQAESILTLIESKTMAGAQAASSQLFGDLSIKISNISDGLKNILADIEAAVDYPEDVGASMGRYASEIDRTVSEMIQILERAQHGEVLRAGVRIAIVGPPNAGKSSLLNYLLNRNRAIVSDIPGTTRDALIETLSIHGIPCEIIDTAGIRDGDSQVEIEGIKRSRQVLQEADIVLVVIDAKSNISQYINEYMKWVTIKPVVFLINKSDLIGVDEVQRIRPSLPAAGHFISALNGSGISEVLDRIRVIISGSSIDVGQAYFLNEKQRDSLRLAIAQVNAGKASIESGRLVEGAIDIRLSIQSLGDINGAVLADDIIGRVFSRFCVGK